MWIHGFIGAICIPSELIPAGIPLSTISGTAARSGRVVGSEPARYCQPVSERPPPIAFSRLTHSSVIRGTCATTQRRSVIENSVLRRLVGRDLLTEVGRLSECTSARQPACATSRAASPEDLPVPDAMNSPIAPVISTSSPKNWMVFAAAP